MKEVMLILGAIYGGLGVLFGAFGAHVLKRKFSEDQLSSFETGVRYQMYHSLIIIISGIIVPFSSFSQLVMGWCFITGIFLFSFSIYGLCLTGMRGNKWRMLGPVTPLGGLLLLMGWILFAVNALDFL